VKRGSEVEIQTIVEIAVEWPREAPRHDCDDHIDG
jgi:hypothetical protein